MENKKLVKILLRDMTELEGMIAEIKTKRDFDALEMEIIHTRARSILQLMQLLREMEPAGVVQEIPVNEKSEFIPSPKEDIVEEEIKSEEETVTETTPETKKSAETLEEEDLIESHEVKKDEVKEQKEVKIEVPEIQQEVKMEMQERVEEDIAVTENETNEVELEEEEQIEANQRLGDSFLKGKSVNDILTDQNKLEFKLSNRPVESIQSAIGINDRFQYIRELFDGSAEKFAQTVTDLDGLKNINEAVKYLQTNFKWKKNETSLKFVNLIKRRFPND